MNHEKALWKASTVFAPDFPRQSSNDRTIQSQRSTRADLVASLGRASDSGMPGYYSVYSFPRGHSQDGFIPKIDCIFIDLDMPADSEYRTGEKTFESWKRSMSALLARARMIASSILEEGQGDHFRAVLSGHKGLHLYLDFPTVSPANGDFNQFKNGLSNYGETVMDWLDSLAGGVNIDPWVDVDGSDLARLARHPNTVHHGSEYDEETRWCVPITVSELADLDVNEYLEYTSGPRWPDIERTPSESAGQKVEQAIRAAASSSRSTGSRATYNSAAVEAYPDRANEDINLDDVKFLTANKPCVMEFRERSDAYAHGDASRAMELNIMAQFVDLGVPRETMHDFFEVIPGYDPDFTDELIDDIIGRGYDEFNCENIAGTSDRSGRAPQFCCGEACAIYQRNDSIQK